MIRRPRNDDDDGGGLDSLLDTMTNVVGILVMVLIATQLGVKDAVTRISDSDVVDPAASFRGVAFGVDVTVCNKQQTADMIRVAGQSRLEKLLCLSQIRGAERLRDRRRVRNDYKRR